MFIQKQNKYFVKKNKSKKEIDRRDFLTTSLLSTPGIVACGMFFSPTASAQKTIKKNRNMKSIYGQGSYPVQGMAAYSYDGALKIMNFERRTLGPKDVAIKLHYCGVCHSDIHTIHEDWGKIQFPQIV